MPSSPIAPVTPTDGNTPAMPGDGNPNTPVQTTPGPDNSGPQAQPEPAAPSPDAQTPTGPEVTPEPTDVQAPTPSPDTPATPGDTPATPETPAAMTGDVAFSVPSGTFEGDLSVGLTGPAGSEIRYTTDGTLPTSASTLYDGNPIALSGTTQLRAQAFTGTTATGFPSTAIYIQRTFDTPSDVPIVIMEGYGGGRPQKTTPGFGGGQLDEATLEENNRFYDVGFMLFEPVNGMSSISNPPTLVSRAGYRERGQSSAGAEKSPYRLEFWDNNNEDLDLPVLGMPADSDWAMIGEYYDKTQIRNSLVIQWGEAMGLQTMERRFAELYINFDGGPLEESDYFGVYAISETIKNQDDRVDINNLKPEDVTEPDISGGYIFKFDQAALDDDEPVIECTGSDLLMSSGGGGFGGGGAGGGNMMPAASDPTAAGNCFQYLGVTDPETLNDQQLTWITNYVQSFHDALHADPIGDYSQYIDVQTFVDQLIIQEITKNVDAFVRSQYFNKDREGLIKAGPLWDYNFSLGEVSTDVEGWQAESQLTSRATEDWFYKLEKDPAFIAKTAARWRELRGGVLADDTIQQAITDLTTPLQNAGARDLARWPNGLMGGFGGGGGGFGGGGMGGGSTPAADPQTYADHVQVLRDYVTGRMAWLDTAFSDF
jgi:hypothetical protein